MLVRCEIDEIDLEGDYTTIDSVQATCLRCGHTTESYGTTDASVRRCLVLLRLECPLRENNFYITVDGED